MAGAAFFAIGFAAGAAFFAVAMTISLIKLRKRLTGLAVIAIHRFGGLDRSTLATNPMNGVASLRATSDGGYRKDTKLDLLPGSLTRHLRAEVVSPSSVRHRIGTR